MRSYISHHWSARSEREIVDSDPPHVCYIILYILYTVYSFSRVPTHEIRSRISEPSVAVQEAVATVAAALTLQFRLWKSFGKKITWQPRRTISMALAVQSTPRLNANLIMFTNLENRGQIWDLVYIMYTFVCVCERARAY